MSPVIAFDIAVVAQKVKVQLLYNGRHAKSEKVGGGVGWWISSRPGWLLELLTELTNQETNFQCNGILLTLNRIIVVIMVRAPRFI